MESLPQHLLEEILLRVPVKSMICFRCVKKSWHTLFQDLTFITKHFRHHLSYKRPSRLIRCDRNKNMRCILYMVKKLCGPSTNTLLRFHFDDDLDDGGFVFFIEGFSMYFDRIDICVCFNGIICLGHSSVGFVLWNSEIKEFKDFPHLLALTLVTIRALVHLVMITILMNSKLLASTLNFRDIQDFYLQVFRFTTKVLVTGDKSIPFLINQSFVFLVIIMNYSSMEFIIGPAVFSWMNAGNIWKPSYPLT